MKSPAFSALLAGLIILLAVAGVVWGLPGPAGPIVVGLVGVAATGAVAAVASLTSNMGVAGPLHGAARAARRGEGVNVPEGIRPELARVYDELALIAEVTGGAAHAKEESVRLKEQHLSLSAELERMGTELARARQQGEAAVDSRAVAAVERACRGLESGLTSLRQRLADQLKRGGEATAGVQELLDSLRDIGEHTDVLMARAEESSQAIVGMTRTTQQVAENMGELSQAVRESVASIEEMTFSIKEVARNVDALSLTAEETSASMNQMDVSIDQVQSNANETARLSEEVTRDAEHGAESILKTIGEIYRIKESSQEAVQVIANLGSRIDAIGQILNVIDEVAEQTNLLALNAAIIAAQAGEHGKGFAVVAEQIKDLAERSGASTKEIADLIKTIQAESRNAIQAVERGAQNVDRGVQVSNEAERALKKILESSEKSTDMMRAIARATVEQAKGSRQVTDSIGRIAETVQQIAAATSEQARGSELIVSTGERMRKISQEVEQSSHQQVSGGQQVSQAIENIRALAQRIAMLHQEKSRRTQHLLAVTQAIESSARAPEELARLEEGVDGLRSSAGSRG